MQEVVKKKIIKWLDVGVIYPIADSKWLSSVQCILKKGGITVVPNRKSRACIYETSERFAWIAES